MLTWRNRANSRSYRRADWIIDAAANPAVLAGIDGRTSSRPLLEHNLFGTINLLELAKQNGPDSPSLATSRVYVHRSSRRAARFTVRNGAFAPSSTEALRWSQRDRCSEQFDTRPPISLYGASKLASEAVALEYGATFDFPVWINRCGVLAGAGQFGRPDQGIFAFWINSYLRQQPMSYIGFDGTGCQTRDCFHPRDLVPLIMAQTREPTTTAKPRVINLGGGAEQAMSLAQLSDWCSKRFPNIRSERPAAAAIRYPVAGDGCESGFAALGLEAAKPHGCHLEEIAVHAEFPDWLRLSAAL